ncbi:autophagy protein [Irineochytrium annulatum]|nr:autophagy protein [Irineochytrium annulatum]
MNITRTSASSSSSGPSSSSHSSGSNPHADGLLFVNYNQDSTCISVGSRHGYRIYNVDPFGKCYGKLDGGIGVVEMLFCTSLVALVGAGEQPAFSPRRLQITNTKRQSTICELTFVTAILAVKLNRKRLIVVLEEHIYIYDISNMKLLHTIDTSPNPNAIIALSPSSENCFLAYPPNTSGASGELLIFDAINLQAVNIITAHKSPLSCINFSFDGTMIATSSDKGTVIRVFSVPNGQKLFQFRRGTYPARIFSIAFDLSSTLLAVSSDTDTIHIFRLINEKDKGTAGSASPPATQSSGPNTERRPSSGSMNSLSGGEKSRLATVYDTLRSPLASATAAVGSYLLPEMITEMWEPQRDFARAKLPAGAKGTQNICALGGGAASGAASLGFAPNGASVAGTGSQGVTAAAAASALGSNESSSPTGIASQQARYVMVVTAAGIFYQFAIDLEQGGECMLQKEFSICDLDEVEVGGAMRTDRG